MLNSTFIAMDGHKFAFVIGAHHSGTSLLKALLQRHPDISGHGKGYDACIIDGDDLRRVGIMEFINNVCDNNKKLLSCHEYTLRKG